MCSARTESRCPPCAYPSQLHCPLHRLALHLRQALELTLFLTQHIDPARRRCKHAHSLTLFHTLCGAARAHPSGFSGNCGGHGGRVKSLRSQRGASLFAKRACLCANPGECLDVIHQWPLSCCPWAILPLPVPLSLTHTSLLSHTHTRSAQPATLPCSSNTSSKWRSTCRASCTNSLLIRSSVGSPDLLKSSFSMVPGG